MTTKAMTITTLVDNTAGAPGVLGEHGLAYWLDTGSKKVLFDTGAGTALVPNAASLGANLAQTDALVLSHGHFDHTSGFPGVLEAGAQPKVFVHPDAFGPKYAALPDGNVPYIGMPPPIRDAAAQYPGLIKMTVPTEVADGLFATGEIPRVTDYEDTGGPFFIDEKCQTPDPLMDDQALYFESKEGTVAVLGCAHAGVVNTLLYIRELTDGKPIHTVMGGIHLLWATEERIKKTIEAFRKFGIQRISTAHCTGAGATAALWGAFPGKCMPSPAGTHVQFEM